MGDKLIEEINYIKRSQYRLRVIKSLEDDVKIPSEIAKDAEIFQNHISNTLSQLKEHNLIECINPEAKRGRLYRLTEYGERIVKELK